MLPSAPLREPPAIFVRGVMPLPAVAPSHSQTLQLGSPKMAGGMHRTSAVFPLSASAITTRRVPTGTCHGACLVVSSEALYLLPRLRMDTLKVGVRSALALAYAKPVPTAARRVPYHLNWWFDAVVVLALLIVVVGYLTT